MRARRDDLACRMSRELGQPFGEAKDAALAKFQNGGQACVCVNRIYVHDSVVEEFTEAFVARVKKLRVGPGLAEGTMVGPLVDEAALEKVHGHVEDAGARGTTLLCGGTRLTEGELAKGNFYAPTVLGNGTPDMRIHQEETFGPVAPILTFSDEEEALSRANETRYGLAAYLYTRDVGRIFKMAERLEYGLIGVNEPFPSVAQAPFGGVKESDMGREGGRYGLEEFLAIKTVAIQMKWIYDEGRAFAARPQFIDQLIASCIATAYPCNTI